MGRSGRIAAFVALLLVAPYPLATARAEKPVPELIGKLNDLRRSHGLRTLKVSPSLMRSAEEYSDKMMSRQYFGHAQRIQASPRYQRLGEILDIHRGRDPDVPWAMRDWTGSPPHMAVMLDPLFTRVGAGYSVGRFQGRACTIWTVHFGRP
jgi:uncharacterized protein YkwD